MITNLLLFNLLPKHFSCLIFFSPPANNSQLGIAATTNIDFILIFPADVLIDLLRFGRRRQLAALKLIGRRLHVLIDVLTFQRAIFIFQIPALCN